MAGAIQADLVQPLRSTRPTRSTHPLAFPVEANNLFLPWAPAFAGEARCMLGAPGSGGYSGRAAIR
jgi:hypothetical protein